ncbi:uncharacterized protein LOC136036239 isoform X2 [Artemia franciscana]|uniref:uncharacterized protein LOC136036239 isoform X2 n=1 Tax=Artemia franciscana TaxID=6661 RepID=UPI0032DB1F47
MGVFRTILVLILVTGSLATWKADYKCRGIDGNFPIRGKCHIYAKCLFGKAKLHACARDSIFHKKLRICVPAFFVSKDDECSPEHDFGVSCQDGAADSSRSALGDMCDRSSGLCLPSTSFTGPAVYAAPQFVVRPAPESVAPPVVGMDMGSVQAMAQAQAQAHASSMGMQDWKPLMQQNLKWAQLPQAPQSTRPASAAPPSPVVGMNMGTAQGMVQVQAEAHASSMGMQALFPTAQSSTPTVGGGPLSSLNCDDGTPVTATPTLQAASCFTKHRPIQVVIERPTPVLDHRVITKTKVVTVTQTSAVPVQTTVPVTGSQQHLGNVFLNQENVQVEAHVVEKPERFDVHLEEYRPVVNTVTVERPLTVERPVIVDNIENIDVNLSGTAGFALGPQLMGKPETTVQVAVTGEEIVGRPDQGAFMGQSFTSRPFVQMQQPGAEWSRRPSAGASAQASAQFTGQSFGAIPAPIVQQMQPIRPSVSAEGSMGASAQAMGQGFGNWQQPTVQMQPIRPSVSAEGSMGASAQAMGQGFGNWQQPTVQMPDRPFVSGEGFGQSFGTWQQPFVQQPRPAIRVPVTTPTLTRRPATTIVIGKKFNCYPITAYRCDETTERTVDTFGKLPWYERPWFRDWAFEDGKDETGLDFEETDDDTEKNPEEADRSYMPRRPYWPRRYPQAVYPYTVYPYGHLTPYYSRYWQRYRSDVPRAFEAEEEERAMAEGKNALEVGLHIRSGMLTGNVKKTENGYEIPSASLNFHSDLNGKTETARVDAALIRHIAKFISDSSTTFQVPILVVTSKDEGKMMDFRNAEIVTANSPETPVKVAEEIDEKGESTAITLPLETIASIMKSTDSVRQNIIDSIDAGKFEGETREAAGSQEERTYNLTLRSENRSGLSRCKYYAKCWKGRPFLKRCIRGHFFSRLHGKCMPRVHVRECWDE